jgi:hypothetical protein
VQRPFEAPTSDPLLEHARAAVINTLVSSFSENRLVASGRVSIYDHKRYFCSLEIDSTQWKHENLFLTKTNTQTGRINRIAR